MVMGAQLDLDARYHTSFVNFYAGLLETPFLGDKLNYILPGSILVFVCCFVVLSWIGYESKAVRMMRQGVTE